MPRRSQSQPFNLPRLLVLVVVSLVSFSSVSVADKIILKDGFELTGELTTNGHQIAVRTDLKTTYVPTEMLLQPEQSSPEAESPETFALNDNIPRTGRRIDSLSGELRAEPFDEFGRRSVYVEGKDHREIVVHQAITEIHPTYVVVDGLNHTWRSVLAIHEIPGDQLIAILRRVTRSDQLPDRLKLAHFLIQARLYGYAKEELSSLRKQMPDAASRIEPLDLQLAKQISQDAIVVTEQSIDIGQITKAKKIIDEMKRVGVPADQEHPWQTLSDRADSINNDIEKGREILEETLQALGQTSNAPEMNGIAEEIVELLSPSNVDRLRPLLVLMETSTTTPAQRLALAVSGWVVGPNLAVSDWDKAVEIAKSRRYVQGILGAQADADVEIAIDRAVAAKMDIGLAAALIPLLPAPPTEIAPGKPTTIAPELGRNECDYIAMLPPDYDRTRQYPLILAIPTVQVQPDQTVRFWSIAAAQIGGVVAVPVNLYGQDRPYEYSLDEHRRFKTILCDARKRFSIDADRVLLAGHEVGAFAALDLGMSHPDELAGVISICGLPRFYSQYYWRNIGHLPIYAVDGSLNGDNPNIMMDYLGRVFQAGDPTLFTVYPGRGRGWYGAELPRIIDWMRRQRRDPWPRTIDACSARHSDTRFYWLEVDTFFPNATIAPQLFDQKKGIKPARMSGEVTRGNTLSIDSNGLESLIVHLSSALVQLDDPNLAIKVNRKVVHQGKVEPDLGTMMREVRRSGDRSRLVMKSIRVK